MPEANTFLPSWEMLLSHNQPTLAWIAGEPGNWTDKAHHFRAGETISKQAVLINDTRRPQPYAVRWSVQQGGIELESQEHTGTIEVGEILKLPIAATITDVSEVTDGSLVMTSTIGSTTHEDHFAFRVYPPTPTPTLTNRIALLDPTGTTAEYLKKLGHKTQAFRNQWDQLETNDLLIIGEKAWADQPMPVEQLQGFVRRGGRVLILAQSPDWWKQHSAFRVSEHVARRMWPTQGSMKHPVVAGLTEADLRDWRGSGAIAPQTHALELDKPIRSAPEFGWHWGNRGSVSGVALEKPHHSGWTPLLEGQFALAYSPLMELSYGEGHLMICTLDLAHRDVQDPVADLLMQRLLQYIDQVEPTPRTEVVFTGSESERDWLWGVGLETTYVDTPDHAQQLWIVGQTSDVTYQQLRSHASTGGHVLVLGANQAVLPEGVELQTAAYGAQPSVPEWPVMQGVSVSNLHLRFNQQIDLLQSQNDAFQVGADGLLGYKTIGEGSLVYVQLHPKQLDTKQDTYLRFSQWMTTQLVTQMATNLGAGFESDLLILQPQENPYAPISLAGEWKVQPEKLLETAASLDNPHQDSGNTGVEQGWHLPEHDDRAWIKANMPKMIEHVDEMFEDKDGSFWLRKEIAIPEVWEGHEVQLHLRRLDDFDVTYFDGHLIGSTTEPIREAWSKNRVYTLPQWMVTPGKHVIAIRVFDHFGGGGMTEHDPSTLLMKVADPPRRRTPYVSDYRTDRANGDNPFRYYRW